MERADFIHLVRLNEHACAHDSAAYRRKVALFAALGYAWVIGCFLVACALLFMTLDAALHGRFRAGHVWALIAAGGLLTASLRALWCRLEPPTGQVLTAADAPALFQALERIRKKIKGPPIHHVLLDAEFNASICQVPRYGLFGGAVNYLTIGLPMLLAIDRPRFLAVMAHEYGHLRGDHGKFVAWIYRTRLSWGRLAYSMRNDSGPFAALTQAFLRWYFPRFLAKTFALARQDEYEADKISGKLLGRDVAGAALAEIDLKGTWLQREFWRSHWSAAAQNPLPVGPFTAMRALLCLPLPEDFARESLRQSLRRISDLDDTHPVLRDRLEALDASKVLPAWSAKPALELLGSKASQWLTHFDKQWCKDNATHWKQHYAYLSRVRARVDALSASLRTNSADQMAELGDLERRLSPRAEVRARYERAIQLSPSHAYGLRGLVQCLPDSAQAQRMDCLEQLFEHSAANRWWACGLAVALLEKPALDGTLDATALRRWRERLKVANEAEDRAWEELTETPFFQSISRHDLSEFEQGELQSDLARCKPIYRTWLVRKNLKEFAYRRCYVLFVELPAMDDEERYDLCRSLERSLDLPGQVMVLWAGHSPTLADIQRNAFDAVYARGVS